jgi:hypothetical protein
MSLPALRKLLTEGLKDKDLVDELKTISRVAAMGVYSYSPFGFLGPIR